MSTTPLRRIVGLCRLLALLPVVACAGSAGRLVDRAGRDAEREVGTRVVDRTVGAAAGAAEDAATADRRAAPDSAPATADSSPEDMPRAGEGADTNFDFLRGDRPIFMEDYSADNLGDFPRRLTLLNGNWDVVEWEGRRLLRGTGGRGSAFQVELPEVLPDRFTVEFDVMFTQPNHTLIMAPSAVEGSWNRYDGALVQVRNTATGLRMPLQKRDITARVTQGVHAIDRPTTIRLMVDGNHAKVYAGAERVANVPNAEIRRSSVLHFEDVYTSSPDHPIFIGPIRVDAGGRDLYAAIERDGHVAVRGILFDSDSDRIRPESRSVLDEIGTMLREHPDLRISIEGHTDSQGAEEYNRDLSQRRADAVRRWLMEQYALGEARLRAVGMGESHPVASNETAEGRQQNRRVELVQVR